MKKKIIVIVCIILAIFLMFVAVGLAGMGYMAYKGLGATEGRVLITGNNSYLFIDESGSPVVMRNAKEKEDLFDGLSTGDEILVIHGPIQESYPGGTDAYYCKKLSDGKFEDIPAQALEGLAQLNWIDSSFKGEKVECSGEDFKFSLVIPEGWNYEKISPVYNLPNIPSDLNIPGILLDKSPREIIFWCGDDKENYISVKYEKSFGVCGTGLECKTIILGGKEAVVGTYDGKESWDYIVFGKFDVDKGTYCSWNYSNEEWNSQHGEMIMKILDTIEYE